MDAKVKVAEDRRGNTVKVTRLDSGGFNVSIRDADNRYVEAACFSEGEAWVVIELLTDYLGERLIGNTPDESGSARGLRPSPEHLKAVRASMTASAPPSSARGEG